MYSYNYGFNRFSVVFSSFIFIEYSLYDLSNDDDNEEELLGTHNSSFSFVKNDQIWVSQIHLSKC